MDARFAAAGTIPRKVTPRRWRSLLAGLTSLALALSFFHGLAFDGDEGMPAISVAQCAGNAGDKAAAHPAPLHGDHCLTHVASVAVQETAVAIEYAPHAYRLDRVRAPEAAEPLSLFEPPRA